MVDRAMVRFEEGAVENIMDFGGGGSCFKMFKTLGYAFRLFFGEKHVFVKKN